MNPEAKEFVPTNPNESFLLGEERPLTTDGGGNVYSRLEARTQHEAEAYEGVGIFGDLDAEISLEGAAIVNEDGIHEKGKSEPELLSTTVMDDCATEKIDVISKLVMEHIRGQLDVISNTIQAWPPLAGLSETDGMAALRDVVLEQCFSAKHIERLNMSEVEVLRLKAIQMIHDTMANLKLKYVKKRNGWAIASKSTAGSKKHPMPGF